MVWSQFLSRSLVALALFVGANGALVAWLAFEFQHEYIAEHLCENRHDPDSDCDGSCVLANRMEAKMDMHHGHDEESQEPVAVLSAPTIIAIAAPVAEIPPDPWRHMGAPLAHTASRPDSGIEGDVFRPPRETTRLVSALVRA